MKRLCLGWFASSCEEEPCSASAGREGMMSERDAAAAAGRGAKVDVDHPRVAARRPLAAMETVMVAVELANRICLVPVFF